MKKPSASQLVALEKMAASSGRIFRLPGGFWSVEGVSLNERKVPSWYASTNTVMSMQRAGLVQRAMAFPEDWKDDRILTPEGERAVAGVQQREAARPARTSPMTVEEADAEAKEMFGPRGFAVESRRFTGHEKPGPGGWVVPEGPIYGYQVGYERTGKRGAILSTIKGSGSSFEEAFQQAREGGRLR